MKNNGNKLSSFLIGSVIIFLVILFIFGCTFFIGGGILNILGFEYTSVGAVLRFFLIYLVISFFIESIIGAVVELLKSSGNLKKYQFNIISFILKVGFDIVALSMAESAVKGIMISNEVIICFAIISYLFESFLERKLDDDK